MRIHVTFTDRVGITQEVLALLVARKLNVEALEMVPPNIYIDAPALSDLLLQDLQAALLQIKGVQSVQWIDLLPGQHRRLQLATLLATVSDPVLAVDPSGHVMLANPRLMDMLGRDPTGEPVSQFLQHANPENNLIADGFRLPVCEVSVQGQKMLLDAIPISDGTAAAKPAGGLITLYPHSSQERAGEPRQSAMGGLDTLIGQSPELAFLKARLRKVASLNAPLFIQGETGTGKELVARACHALSPRSAAPFLALNCAALTESLAESELFGYAAGAFTGAQRGGKPGLLEQADRGTVFLDEIGEMSLYLQAKLLRFLSDGSFRRVGGEREVRVNVRVLCATHRDLEQKVSEGTFREDLYYRLNVLNVQVPPLRERGHDILLLAKHFLKQACKQIKRAECRLAPSTYPKLLQNNWSGNVRQLQSVIFRAAAICEANLIGCDDLELAATPHTEIKAQAVEVLSLDDAVQGFEKALLTRLYPQYPSTRQLAARLNTSHTAIGLRLRKYGIAVAMPLRSDRQPRPRSIISR